MLLREEWKAVIPIGHLYLFECDSLRNLLSSVGFVDVENLTGPSDFEKELALAENSGLCKLTPEELAKVKEMARLDTEKAAEEGSSSNRRDLGLVMCARKPWDSIQQKSAYSEKIPKQAFKMSFAGCLVRRLGETPTRITKCTISRTAGSDGLPLRNGSSPTGSGGPRTCSSSPPRSWTRFFQARRCRSGLHYPRLMGRSRSIRTRTSMFWNIAPSCTWMPMLPAPG